MPSSCCGLGLLFKTARDLRALTKACGGPDPGRPANQALYRRASHDTRAPHTPHGWGRAPNGYRTDLDAACLGLARWCSVHTTAEAGVRSAQAGTTPYTTSQNQRCVYFRDSYEPQGADHLPAKRNWPTTYQGGCFAPEGRAATQKHKLLVTAQVARDCHAAACKWNRRSTGRFAKTA